MHFFMGHYSLVQDFISPDIRFIVIIAFLKYYTVLFLRNRVEGSKRMAFKFVVNVSQARDSRKVYLILCHYKNRCDLLYCKQARNFCASIQGLLHKNASSK
jgi:hypothetical protein